MQTIDRDRDRKSLQDLAKMAQGMTPPPSSVAVPSSRSVASLPAPSSKDDSGIVDLAAASAADPGAAMRAQSTPLASQSIYEDVPPPPPVNAPPPSYVPPPMHAYQQPAPSVPPPPVASVPPPVASVYPIGPSIQKKSGAGGLVFALGGLLAISAAAAGGFLYLRAHKAEPAPVAATQTAEAPKAEPVVVAQNNDKPAAPDMVAAPADKPADGAMDVSSLSATPSAPSAAKKVRSSGAKVAAAPKAEAPAADEAPAPAQAKADKAKLDSMLAAQAGGDAKPAPAAPAGPSGDLGSAMKGASGGGIMSEQQKPAAGSSGSGGNVPTKPSQGAVTGALGAVLPAARDCLGPDDVISRASVVFNSDGSVNSVSVSGGAAGKPAATCIEKELKKARLQPFAEPTYTANVTIRHN